MRGQVEASASGKNPAQPSKNRTADQDDATLALIKSDLEQLKQAVRCCISDSNRSCYTKSRTSLVDAMNEMKAVLPSANRPRINTTPVPASR